MRVKWSAWSSSRYSNNPSSNPAEEYFFVRWIIWKKTKKRPGMAHLKWQLYKLWLHGRIYNIDHTKVDINRLTLDEWTKYVQDLSCLQWGTSQLPKNPYISFYLKVNPFRTCERWWIENAMKIWNKFIHFFTQSHNKSTNERGYTPEVLHFCFTSPDNVHFIEIWHKVEDPQSYRVLVSFRR